MNCIFTTAFIDIANKSCRTLEQYMNWFINLCESGIYIIIYTSAIYYNKLVNLKNKYTNIIEIIIKELDELPIKKEITDEFTLPNCRNNDKDTHNYMILMNSKIYLVSETAQKYKSNYYAWIDFGIFHILHDKADAFKKLNLISNYPYKNNFIAFPGCWSNNSSFNYDSIIWRFCGGFFITDTINLYKLNELNNNIIANYIISKKKIVWETNIWSIIESYLNMGWYQADHNNTILNIP